jgi:hypothetical protein
LGGSVVAPAVVQALTIDNFDRDDGTPINISSTGLYQYSFDIGLPSEARYRQLLWMKDFGQAATSWDLTPSMN